MVNFNQLQRMFGDLTGIDVLDCLCWTFGIQQAIIYIDGSRMSLVDMYDDMDVIGLLLAKDIKVRFFGGPAPGKWWDGNLLNMFLDHFIYAYLKGKKTTVNKVMHLAKQYA